METQVTEDQTADDSATQSAPEGAESGGGTAVLGQGTDQATDSQKLGWRKQLKAEFQTDEDAAAFESPTDLFRAFKEQKQQLEGSIPTLKEDATDEERAAWYQKIGVPESPEGYQLQSEGKPGEMEQQIAKFAHAANLRPDQAKAFYDQVVESQRGSIEDATAELKGEWKGEYDNKIASANRLLKQAGGDAALRAFATSSAGSNPAIVRALVAIADMVSEDSVETGRPGSAPADDRSMYGGPMLAFKGLNDD